MQVRIDRTGPKGLLQPIADALKLLSKEIIFPDQGQQKPVRAGTGTVHCSGTGCMGGDSIHSDLVLANIDASLLAIMAITSMGVWRHHCWLGRQPPRTFPAAMRSAAQIVSYEIAMGFALVGVLMASFAQPGRDRRAAGPRHDGWLGVAELVAALPVLRHRVPDFRRG